MNERDVKLGYEKNKPTAPFHVGQSLKVVLVGRNTITVSYFDGRTQTVTKQLEVVVDDQLPPFEEPVGSNDYRSTPAQAHHDFCDGLGNPIRPGGTMANATDEQLGYPDAIDILTEGEGDDTFEDGEGI